MTKLFKSWAKPMLVLLGITVFAFILRYIRLDSFPIFADEAIYIRWAQIMKAESTLRFLPLSDGKQPLFMWIVIPFFKVFSDPLVAGRFPSVLTGLGSLLGIFTLSYLVFKSKWTSLVSSLLYAISPFFVFFDRMALVDSMLTMFGIWFLVCGYLTAKYGRLDTALLAGFALGGAWLTKSPAIFFGITSFSLILLANQKIKFLGLQIISTLIGYGFYNILRLGPNFHLISSRNQDYIYPISHLWQSPLDPFLPYVDRVFRWISVMGPIFVVILGLIFISTNFKKYYIEILFLTFWFIFPSFSVAMFTRAITARYILFTLPPLFILAGQAFSEKLFKKYKYILISLLVLNLIFALKFDLKLITSPLAAELPPAERSGYLVEWSSGIGIKEVSAKLIEIRDANPDKQLIVGTEGYFGTLPDGLQMYLQNEPRVTVIGVGLSINKIPDQLENAKRAGDLVFLVANSSRLTFEKDFSEYGLEVIYSVQKPDREKNTHEWTANGDYDIFYLFQLI